MKTTITIIIVPPLFLRITFSQHHTHITTTIPLSILTMRLPRTISENSFDINFCIFILCQLYIILDFKYLLLVSGILTLLSLYVCIVGLLYIFRFKHEGREKELFFDISKNVFLPLVLCITWLIIYDAYASHDLNPLKLIGIYIVGV